jgi:hypothetical protein
MINSISRVTDIHVSDPYLYTKNPDSNFFRTFRDFGNPTNTIFHLIDRIKSEIIEFKAETNDEQTKPLWLVLQGYGEVSDHPSHNLHIPDADYMYAQIWGAICLGATGIFIYSQHNAGTEAYKRRALYSNSNSPLYEGVSHANHVQTWNAISRAYRLIKMYESVLLQETVSIEISNDERIITLTKALDDNIFIFSLNTYRKTLNVELELWVLPHSAVLRILPDGEVISIGQNNNALSMTYQPFELNVFKLIRM